MVPLAVLSPFSKVFGDIPHQDCEFRAIKELTQAAIRAVAAVRKQQAGTDPLELSVAACGTATCGGNSSGW